MSKNSTEKGKLDTKKQELLETVIKRGVKIGRRSNEKIEKVLRE